MNRYTALFFATMLALGASAQAAEPPKAGHATPGETAAQPAPEGHGAMMRQHMGMMREHGKREHQSYADVVLKFSDQLKLSDEQIGRKQKA